MARKSGVRDVIFDVWQDNLDSSPKDIRTTVQEKLGARLSKKGTYPGLRLVQQYVAEFKKNLGQLVDEDKPWSIAASVRCELSPEDTKDLFDIWRASLALDRPISIRQAKWIVYIRGLYRDPEPSSPEDNYAKKVTRNLWLIRQSWLYSILERASRIMGEKYFDTFNLDAASFMLPWEHATALKLGKVLRINFSQEALAKIEKHGTSLTSPPKSIKSVEQAAWHSVRAEPPPDMEITDIFGEDALPEEEDLICAYWLMYLSKGPNWKSLDYFKQRKILLYLRMWVKKHSSMTIRDYLSLTEQHSALVLSPRLLTMVGYEVSPEDLKLYAKLHEEEVKQAHLGWKLLPAEVKRRFINEDETDEDLDLLHSADDQRKTEIEQIEKEIIELVQSKGGAPNNRRGWEVVETFWESIRDEWVKKHPEYKKIKKHVSNIFGPLGSIDEYLQPEDIQSEYERIIEKHKEGGKA